MILALQTSGISNMKTKHIQTETSPGNCVALAIQRRPSPGAGKPLQRHFHRRSLLTACHSLSRQVGCLVAAGLLQAGVASAVDDHGDTMATATAINFPSTTPGAINQAGDLDLFKFTLSAATNVEIKSNAKPTQMFGELIDSAGKVIASATSNLSLYDFSIKRHLAAGTYYLKARHYNATRTSGDYQVLVLAATTPVADDHGNTLSSATVCSFPSSNVGGINFPGDADLFKFTLANSSKVLINSVGSTDVTGELIDSSGKVLMFNDDGFGYPNFRLAKDLLTAGVYYVRVKHNDLVEGFGNYTLKIDVNEPVVTTQEPSVSSKTPWDSFFTIPDGSAVASVASNTRFVTTTNGGYKDHCFRIDNYSSSNGRGNLILSGTPIVTITGPGASQFRVVTQPVRTIAPFQAATFVIRFQPTLPGEHTATVSFASNSSTASLSPYTFKIVGAGPDVPDDHGDTPERATSISVPGSANGIYNYAADIDTFEFTVDETSDLVAYSVSDLTTGARLYMVGPDGRLRNVFWDRYPTQGDNFGLSCRIVPGTYYLSLSFGVSTVAGSTYQVIFNTTPVGSPDIRVYGTSRIANGSAGAGYYAGGTAGGTTHWTGQGYRDYTFEIENNGAPNLELTGVPAVSLSGTDASQFSISSQPSSTSVAAGSRTRFTLRFAPTVSGRKSVTVSVASNDPDEGSFSFNVSNISYSMADDAHGNTLETASAISGIPANIPAGFEYPGDVDWFRFDLAAPATVRIKSTGLDDPFGSGDPYGELYDAAGALLEQNDDEPWSLNFLIERSLPAGTYYVKVSKGGAAYRLVLDYVN